jgi:hypothetical protein
MMTFHNSKEIVMPLATFASQEDAAAVYDAKRQQSETNGKGCFLYTGSRNNDGYGQVAVSVIDAHGRKATKMFLVHHVAWYATGRQMPVQGEHLSHLCHSRNCWNPEHLCVETVQANNSRKGCPGNVICHHCTLLAYACPHQPKCI